MMVPMMAMLAGATPGTREALVTAAVTKLARDCPQSLFSIPPKIKRILNFLCLCL